MTLSYDDSTNMLAKDCIRRYIFMAFYQKRSMV